jgi:hypothetical protein
MNKGSISASAEAVYSPPAYEGRLPNYAAAADRKRVVRLLCKGRCCKTRWAEMRVDYPGEDVLRRSRVLDFAATCLKCGYTARDPYNWYRG